MRSETSGRGRAPGYSRDQIARTAVGIADSEGLEAVSMRRIAREIGAGPMSLYRYVHDKDELHALMVDAALDEAEDQHPDGDASGGWRAMLRDMGWSIRRLVLAHPWYPVLQAGIPAPSPRMVAGMESMMAAIDGLGLGVDEMLEIIMTVMTFAMGAAQDETVEARAMLRHGLNAAQWQQRQAPYIRSLIESGDYPYLKRIIVDANIPHEGAEPIFGRALDRLIAGIAATLPSGPERGRDRPAAAPTADDMQFAAYGRRRR